MDRTPVLLADDHTLVRAGLHNALDGLPEIEITGEVGNGCKFHRRAFLDKKDLDTASLARWWKTPSDSDQELEIVDVRPRGTTADQISQRFEERIRIVSAE